MTGDAVVACGAAAEATRDAGGDAWAVVEIAGRLARCRLSPAPRDLGLSAALGLLPVDHPRAVARVPQGAPLPLADARGRKGRGAWDSAPDLARSVVAKAVQAARIPLSRGRDPACGTGAFLVAMDEAGIAEIEGSDLDPVALAVAAVAAPRARLSQRSGLLPAPAVALVVGNPPFVSPEHQDKLLRAALRQRFPWLGARFDLAVPFAAACVEQVAPGGALGLVLPSSLFCQPYGAPLRRRWLEAHRVAALSPPRPFPGAAVDVVELVLGIHQEPAPLPPHGLDPAALLRIPGAPLGQALRPGDVALLEQIHAASVPLGSLCEVDTGVVSHGAHGGKAALLHDEPGPGRVPYVDARDLGTGRRRWLDYQPERMHRPKRPALFLDEKVLVQRLRGKGPVRAWLDDTGLFAGHTLTVLRPLPGAGLPARRVLELVQAPEIDGLVRLERGARLDLYPRDLAALPVPRRWLVEPGLSLVEAWGLPAAAGERLRQAAAARPAALDGAVG